MAGPNTRTTQLFINYGNNQRTGPGRIRGLWQVTEGMDLLISFTEVMAKGAPGGRGPDQGLIGTRASYLQQNSLIWTRSKSATLVTAAPAPPASK